MNKKLTIAGVLAATVLAVGMFVSAPIATMAFNEDRGNQDRRANWHTSASDDHFPVDENGDPLANPCTTDDDTEGQWWHKVSPNGKDVFACKDHPEEQPEDDEDEDEDG